MAAFFGRLQASRAAIAGSMFLSGSGFSHSQCQDSRAWWDRTTTTNLPFAPNWWDNTVDRSQPTKPCQVMFVLGGPGTRLPLPCTPYPLYYSPDGSCDAEVSSLGLLGSFSLLPSLFFLRVSLLMSAATPCPSSFFPRTAAAPVLSRSSATSSQCVKSCCGRCWQRHSV